MVSCTQDSGFLVGPRVLGLSDASLVRPGLSRAVLPGGDAYEQQSGPWSTGQLPSFNGLISDSSLCPCGGAGDSSRSRRSTPHPKVAGIER